MARRTTSRRYHKNVASPSNVHLSTEAIGSNTIGITCSSHNANQMPPSANATIGSAERAANRSSSSEGSE